MRRSSSMPSAPASCRTRAITATKARTRSATWPGPSAASTCRASRPSGSATSRPSRAARRSRARPPLPAGCSSARRERTRSAATGSSWGSSRRRRLPTYSHGFPFAIVEEFAHRTGRGVLGNVPASGTEIIQELGEEHQADRQVDRLHVGRLRLPACRPRRDDPARRALPRVRDRARDPDGAGCRRSRDRAPVHRRARQLRAHPGRRDWALEPRRPNYLSLMREAGRGSTASARSRTSSPASTSTRRT